MAGSRFIKKKKAPGLMLTSLLDMFTIILIFLIVSFEAEDQEFKLNSNLTLPESSARSVFKPAVNIAITPGSLVVEDRQLLKLDDGRFKEEYYAQDEIPELVEVLERAYAIRYGDMSEEELASEETGPIVLVQADKELDYRTLFLVLKSSGKAGFVKYRLAIMKQ